MNYRPRIADKLLENKLKGMGAVLVEGAKWCGKTTTGEQHAASVLYMDNPKDRTSNIQMVKINPDFLLKGAIPRLISPVESPDSQRVIGRIRSRAIRPTPE